MLLPDGREFYFRTVGISYAPPLDEYDNPTKGPGSQAVQTYILTVIKRTPKGVWLYEGKCSEIQIGQVRQFWRTDKHRCKFVLETANKRYAWPTEREAIESFLARKARERSIYGYRVKIIDMHTKIAQEALEALDGTSNTKPKLGTIRIGLVESEYRSPDTGLVSS